MNQAKAKLKRLTMVPLTQQPRNPLKEACLRKLTTEDIQYHLYVREKVDRGIRAIIKTV